MGTLRPSRDHGEVWAAFGSSCQDVFATRRKLGQITRVSSALLAASPSRLLNLHRLSRVFRHTPVCASGLTNNLVRGPFFAGIEEAKLLILNWLPPRDSNPDMLIQSQLSCR